MTFPRTPTKINSSGPVSCIVQDNLHPHDFDNRSELRDYIFRKLASRKYEVNTIKLFPEPNTWYPKPAAPASDGKPPLTTTNCHQPAPSALNQILVLLKLVDELHQPFRKLVPFSLIIDVGWLSTLLDIYPIAPTAFLKCEMEFLSIQSENHPQPNQVVFFTMLEIIRLLLKKPQEDIQWSFIDVYLSEKIVGWRHDVHDSKTLTAQYILKLSTYIRTELSSVNLSRSLNRLDEWTEVLSLDLRRCRSSVFLPGRDRLEIYYHVTSGDSNDGHFRTIERIETQYLPTMMKDASITGLRLLQKLMYLTRQFSFRLLHSVERRKDKSKTREFLNKLSDLAELSIDVWSQCGPDASAAEIFEILRIMDGIDNRLQKAGFKDGVFFKAKVKFMRWCCTQDWFQRSVAELHPEWLMRIDTLNEK